MKLLSCFLNSLAITSANTAAAQVDEDSKPHILRRRMTYGIKEVEQSSERSNPHHLNHDNDRSSQEPNKRDAIVDAIIMEEDMGAFWDRVLQSSYGPIITPVSPAPTPTPAPYAPTTYNAPSPVPAPVITSAAPTIVGPTYPAKTSQPSVTTPSISYYTPVQVQPDTHVPVTIIAPTLFKCPSGSKLVKKNSKGWTKSKKSKKSTKISTISKGTKVGNNKQGSSDDASYEQLYVCESNKSKKSYKSKTKHGVVSVGTYGEKPKSTTKKSTTKKSGSGPLVHDRSKNNSSATRESKSPSAYARSGTSFKATFQPSGISKQTAASKENNNSSSGGGSEETTFYPTHFH